MQHQECVILVDWDNVPSPKAAQFRDFAESIVFVLSGKLWREVKKFKFRLYGGWYSEQNMTKQAQETLGRLQGAFPAVISYKWNQRDISAIVTAEVATTLLSEPSKILFHTYREKACPRGLRIESTESLGCAKQDCGLRSLKKLIKKGRCPEDGCAITKDALIWRNEQKLIDVLISVDTLTCASERDAITVLVTADHDLWPAMLHLCAIGKKIIHINPRPDQTPPVYYRPNSQDYIYLEV